MSTVVVLETGEAGVPEGTLGALALAVGLGDVLAVVSHAGPDVLATLAAAGVAEVAALTADPSGPPADAAQVAATLAQLLGPDPDDARTPADGRTPADEPTRADTGRHADVVVAAPTPWGREVQGRLAVRLGAPLVTGVEQVRRTDGRVVVVVDAGDGTTAVRSTAGRPVLLLAAPGLPVDADPAHDGADGGGGARAGRDVPTDGLRAVAAPIVRRLPAAPTAVPAVGVASVVDEDAVGAPLARARVVVAAGRGLGSAAQADALRRWTESVGAVFGSARGPVEAGWVPFDRLIGQTGTTISPDVYVTFGVSGAPQHLAGVRDAGTIVAVNSDPDAPIMRGADVAVVGDAVAVLRLLSRA
ncbi:electron transfer flavoprotein subunit alpha/FixB family protein [Curtobacterium sp. MCBD17_028]|uniref:electron transfer flavoprotein subunit alpha/FixB family protein n=1 Tax=Curtobacterium sp. MCBD17_028 TaxID=2175670 RepID=UPI000DA97608|nr:FAD-binding protein [Curtobacterium sp. MCBD17_028]PZE24149.1 hypothetical protein DEI86_12845 [Curtobacterium sp. MCBD17_028]